LLKIYSIEERISDKITKYYIEVGGKRIRFSDVIEFLTTSDDFIIQFNNILKASNFSSYFWEVKPVLKHSLQNPFEFVLVESKRLEQISADKRAFGAYFTKGKPVVHFSNLRNDAELIVPSPISNQTDYSQISRFVRTAEDKQIVDFWKKVGQIYFKSIGDQKKWLSTSGLGVYWLHVRVDNRPKYYQFSEYKN
jgi:hypothetical protein